MMNLSNHLSRFTQWGLAVSIVSAAIAFPAISQQPQQQPLNSIEVLVNDEPISSFDINQRLRLVIAISGGVNSQEEFKQVREQVIRSMVDERLQLQEAAEVDLKIGDDQLEEFFARRAEGIGQQPEQFAQALLSIGSSKKSMQTQMEAEIAWSQLVQGRLGAFVSVSDEEVESFIQRIYDNRGKFEYRLGEIILLADSPEQAASVEANAKQLVEQIRSGSAFTQIAQQLSASSTAAVGGDLGWITVDDLSPSYSQQVEDAKVGDVLDPIRTPGGYTILSVSDRRRVLTVDPLDAQVLVSQLLLPKEEYETGREQYESVAAGLKDTTTQCVDVASLATQAGVTSQTEIAPLRLRDLQGDVRGRVQKLEIGQATDMFESDDGLRVLILCDRQEPIVQEPDFDAIYNQLEQQRMSMMARRYLRDIRRDAIVDYR
jgi:peptidyl-prolyl cis-trans isomerase SurA